MNALITGYSAIKGGYKIYKYAKKFKNKKISTSNMELAGTRKERSDMILEPLQVMVQLSLLAYSPLGTKVSVSDNILHLHPPTWSQGIWRWYNSDSQNDLYYLFHAIRRYYKWYKNDENNNKIFTFILTNAVRGINKLIETYSQTEQTAITHTLALYKNVLELESPDLFKDTTTESINIDTVFENIKNIYDKRLLKIIYNSLLIMDDENTTEKQCALYLNGLLEMLQPTNENIRSWIREKLTC